MRHSKVKGELAALQQRHRGLLTPASVVSFAKDPATELHKCFCWDDGVAAERYRLQQAQEVIRLQVTVIKGTKTREFVSLSIDRRRGGGTYRRIDLVLADRRLKAQLVKDARRELRSFVEKYRTLRKIAAFAKVFRAIEKVA